MTEQIPGPRALPILGNILDLRDPDGVNIRPLERMIDVYGPIVKFKVAGRETVVVGGYDLFEELCDETRFWKVRHEILVSGEDPNAVSGLFAQANEKLVDWQQAHRILMPAFGPLAIEKMFPEMDDIATQLLLKWARQGPDAKILASEDFSRLTLDTIALCAMDYRFNSFYTNEMHPFVQAMNRGLGEKNSRNQIGSRIKSLMPGHKEQIQKDQKLILQTGADIVAQRRANPVDKKDLLNAMLHGKDPKTGETMRDELIVANMRTFLIAGHETTSGMLTFAFAEMLKNPSTYFKAQKEVDEVIGKEKVNVKHLGKLKYLNALLKETLRLHPTAPAYFRAVRPENKEEKPTIGGGKYAMPGTAGVLCLLTKIQVDPKIWGNDANEFRPERMLDENFEKLPQAAWKPFGTGLRACIGRAFAWQEALLICASILQNFNMTMDDPTYELKIVQTLTIKPKDFYMRAKLRPGLTAAGLQERLAGRANVAEANGAGNPTAAEEEIVGDENLRILYGSNTGTCETLARKLASQAGQHGFKAGVVELDNAIEQLPTDMPVVVITASYEGQPCDNAASFAAWLEAQRDPTLLKGVQYAVFGVGHSDWRDTFQRQPKLINDKLAALGASRLAERGETDALKNSLFTDFEDWAEKTLWPALPQAESKRVSSIKRVKSSLRMDVKKEDRAAHLNQRNLRWAKVLDAKQLTAFGSPQKRHIEIGLPEEMSYQVGDYLAILPLNPEASIKRVMHRFKINIESIITIADAGPTNLPANVPMHVDDLLRGYVELSQPATLRDVHTLSEAATGVDKQKLTDLTDQTMYEASILQHRISILDLLEQYPSVDLPFDQFLTMLPPLQTRHYSISSSSLAQPDSCTLTYSVIDAPTMSGLGDRFQGVAGTYLKTLRKGDDVLVSVRATNKLFRLPADQANTPLMMFCAGSGLAPFRGFIQERAYLIKEGKRKLAPALLFFGCRSRKEDALYEEELAEWQKIGAVDVRYAFSKSPADSAGCKYVQERMLHDKAEVVDLFERGSMVYVCGSRAVATELGGAARELVKWKAEMEGKQLSSEMVESFMSVMKNSRFVSDVFT
ncbi:uncharacterized protein PV09_02646 [Verruconis gallopava]|uniref:Bifunctional cytochrome P450/NADPH--P450 reductase n=1 Tax=Verruconis gallopava TaxID=253628 RepID=A0A0D2AJB8_9PEZI|nr:uncharacterized protein PV09_02646 [Verruconis gallopava]KIW06988.1 hypothetical protein PV09_02646 [Verruconis gallopava]